MPHVLRANADPNAAYIDGRIGDLMNLIEDIGGHLLTHQAESWKHINGMTLAIFVEFERDLVNRMEIYEKKLEE